MKTMERMTNPYFQDTEFASTMKAKHVFGDSHSDRDDENNLLNQSDPTQQSDPIESLLSGQPDLRDPAICSDSEGVIFEVNQVILWSLCSLRGTRVILQNLSFLNQA